MAVKTSAYAACDVLPEAFVPHVWDIVPEVYCVGHDPAHDWTWYMGRRGKTFGWFKDPRQHISRLIRRQEFQWDTWTLFQVGGVRPASRLNYAFRGYIFPFKVAHARCSNCTLAYMSHVNG